MAGKRIKEGLAVDGEIGEAEGALGREGDGMGSGSRGLRAGFCLALREKGFDSSEKRRV